MLACVFLILNFYLYNSYAELSKCNVRARTEYGWVCGLQRWSEGGQIYASFRGVPYAKQPVGELRFKELQPPEPWTHDYDAREEGPVCPQHDEIYNDLTQPKYGMNEACIHVNVHVPLYALPNHAKDEEGYDINDKKELKSIHIPNKSHVKDETGEDLIADAKSKETYKTGVDESAKSWIKEHEIVNSSLSDWFDNHKHGIGSIWSNYLDSKKITESKNKPLEPENSEQAAKRQVERQNRSLNDARPENHEKSEEGEFSSNKKHRSVKLLPVLVYIHGGGFLGGSGDADLHGPEYLVSKDVIVITFNYRINVFGFLSLNTPSIPGNNGLRDQVTLLRWVQRNVEYFGGDRNDVTLMGQSAGASSAHLLSLSDTTKGLFKRVILMSGTAYEAFYTTSPLFTAAVNAAFFANLGIMSVDPEEIHRELTNMPLRRIIAAYYLLQAQTGLITFPPVVETRYPGITTVLDRDPEIMLAEGKGNEYPLIVGFASAEVETFRRMLDYKNFVSRIEANPRLILPVDITFSTPPNVSLALGEKSAHRCMEHKSLLDAVVMCYSEGLFQYQPFRLVRTRANMKAAPSFLYQFSYESETRVFQKALRLQDYRGAAHIEDLTYVFRSNSVLPPNSSFPPKDKDDMMKDWMTSFVVNFMYCSDPTCSKNGSKSGWPQVTKDHLVYEDIESPYVYKFKNPSDNLQDMIEFYDKIYEVRYK